MITIFDFYGKANEVANWIIWLIASVIIAVTIAFYVLRSIGLFKLATRNGEEKFSFMAWIPFVWIYLVCKLVKEGRFFNFSFKNIALWICIIFSITQVCMIVYNVLCYLPIVVYFINGGEIHIYAAEKFTPMANFVEYWVQGSGLYVKSSAVTGGLNYANGFANPQLVVNVLNVVYYVNKVLDLICTILLIFVYFNFFRNYWPEHYIMATILSFLVGLFPIFAFVIRNKKAVSYKDYLRSRYNGYYYGPQNPYFRNAQNPPPQHPFEEFADKGEVDPGNPFSEFGDNNEDKKDE